MTDLVEIKFAGGAMEATIGPDGKPWLSLTRACEDLGISPKPQATKLKTKPWATLTMIVTVGSTGKEREMLFISENTVPMWLATINDSKVKEELRPRLRAYQVEAADVLHKHFMPKIEDKYTKMMSALNGVSMDLVDASRDHEERIRKLEAGSFAPMGFHDKKRVRVRFHMRFLQEWRSRMSGMTNTEKGELFRAVGGHMKKEFGERELEN